MARRVQTENCYDYGQEIDLEGLSGEDEAYLLDGDESSDGVEGG